MSLRPCDTLRCVTDLARGEALSRRINSNLLLVGSLPADSTEEAFRAGGELFGDLVFALPDGETGPRQFWAAYEHSHMWAPHADTVIVKPPVHPPKHFGDMTVLKLPEGREDFHVERWPRIDDAIESYGAFTRLRDEGAIPEGLRFQVSLPFCTSGTTGFRANFAHDFPIIQRAYEDLFAREIERLTAIVPADDLAIQWDVCMEVLDLEGVLTWMDSEGSWDRFAGPTTRITRLIPEEAYVGYHFCYGTFPSWPMHEAKDMELLVRMSNYALEHSGRQVDFLHLAGPKDLRSEDDRFFAPLRGLRASDARVFLGIVLPVDGEDGLRRRYATASKYFDDFGVAMYCGFGRQPGQDGMETMREHRNVVKSVLGARTG